MRLRCLLFAFFVFLSNGCSVFMARCGRDLAPLATRDQVHQEFGEPVAIGTATDGQVFEDYLTRRKYAEVGRSYSDGLGFAMTYGLTEFIAFPLELFRNGKRLLIGQTLRFEYDSAGDITRADLNGDECLIRRTQETLDLPPVPEPGRNPETSK